MAPGIASAEIELAMGISLPASSYLWKARETAGDVELPLVFSSSANGMEPWTH